VRDSGAIVSMTAASYLYHAADFILVFIQWICSGAVRWFPIIDAEARFCKTVFGPLLFLSMVFLECIYCSLAIVNAYLRCGTLLKGCKMD